MGNNGFHCAVGLHDDSFGQIQEHYQDAVPFDGTLQKS
jgi:hypothetical protein